MVNYYITNTPASWELLAGALYYLGEQTALTKVTSYFQSQPGMCGRGLKWEVTYPNTLWLEDVRITEMYRSCHYNASLCNSNCMCYNASAEWLTCCCHQCVMYSLTTRSKIKLLDTTCSKRLKSTTVSRHSVSCACSTMHFTMTATFTFTEKPALSVGVVLCLQLPFNR